MDQILKLNERPYRLCDIGEGECTLFITSAPAVTSLEQTYRHLCRAFQRMIIVDVAQVITSQISTLNSEEVEIVTDDIKLLLDIFWLERVCIEIDGKCEQLSCRLSSVHRVFCVKSVT